MILKLIINQDIITHDMRHASCDMNATMDPTTNESNGTTGSTAEGHTESVIYVDENTEYDRKMTEIMVGARVGYMRLDIGSVGGKLAWCRWNDRRLKKVKVKELVQNFQRHGLNNARYDTVIPIAMKMSWIITKPVSDIEGRSINTLPAVIFTAEGEKALEDQLIAPFGGNHRQEALTDYSKLLLESLEDLRKTQKDLKNLQVESKENSIGGDEEIQKEIMRLVAEEKGAERRVSACRWWGIAVFDLGECLWYQTVHPN